MKRADYRITEKELLEVELPQQSRTYKPVSHEELIVLTNEGLKNAGMTVNRVNYSAQMAGQIATAKYTIKDLQDKDMQLMIGWQNSYNKTLSLKFAIGSEIFICSNGCVSGSIGAFKRKHTGDVQEFTPSMITEYIAGATSAFKDLQKEREIMKNIIISKKETSEMLGRLYVEKDYITSVQLNIVKDELIKPTHNYGATKSMWELYNFVTFAMKNVAPREYFYSHIKVHEFFMSYCREENTDLYVIEEEPLLTSAQILLPTSY